MSVYMCVYIVSYILEKSLQLTFCTLFKYAFVCCTFSSMALRSLSLASATLANVVMASLQSCKRWPNASNSPCIRPEASKPISAAIFVTISRSSDKRSVCEFKLSWQICVGIEIEDIYKQMP